MEPTVVQRFCFDGIHGLLATMWDAMPGRLKFRIRGGILWHNHRRSLELISKEFANKTMFNK